MLCFFLTLIARAAAQHTIVDLLFDDRNIPIVPNVIVPGLSRFDSNDTRLNISLMMDSETEIDIGVSHAFNASLFSGSIYTADNVELQTSQDGRFEPYHAQSTAINLGIGPGSDLLGLYDTISVVRSGSGHGLLILNDTNSTLFYQHCVPDSILRIPINLTSSPYVDIHFRLVQLTDDGEILGSQRDPTYIYHDEKFIFKLPPSLVDEIYRIITDSGAIIDVRDSIATNCVYDTLRSQLPNVVLNFFHADGNLVFYPDDYIRFDRETDVCSINFSRSRDGGARALNPLAIPNVNVHISNNELLICDSSRQ